MSTNIFADKTVAIIGFGVFGNLLAKILHSEFSLDRVEVYDAKIVEAAEDYINVVDLADAARADLIWLAVPFEALEAVTKEIARFAKPDAIIIDVLSVKSKPVQVMQKNLADFQLIATHPLFGPQSYQGNLRGLVWVIHNISAGEFFDEFQQALVEKGAKVKIVDPIEHDKEMAIVHGLTFFIGRSLMTMDISASSFGTGYYERLLSLAELEKGHSEQLFRTIELANPYAASVRQRFLEIASGINSTLSDQ